MSNQEQHLFPELGECWWDFDEEMNVGIECEHPPHDKHYLLTLKSPKENCEGVIEIACAICDFLNGKHARVTPTAERVKELLAAMTEDQRLELFSRYCKSCGADDPKCQCWNDK